MLLKMILDARIGVKLAVSGACTLLLVGGMAAVTYTSISDIREQSSFMQRASAVALTAKEAQFRFMAAGYQNLAIATGWRAETISGTAKTATAEVNAALTEVDHAIDIAVKEDRKDSLRQAKGFMEQYAKAADDGTKRRLELIDAYRGRFQGETDKLQADLAGSVGRLAGNPQAIAAIASLSASLIKHQQAMALRLLGGDDPSLEAARAALLAAKDKLTGDELHGLAASVESYDLAAVELGRLAKQSDEVWFGTAKPARVKAQDTLAGASIAASELAETSGQQALLTADAAIHDSVVVSLLALLLVFGVNFTFTRLVIKPILALTQVMLRLAHGELGVVVPPARGDEVGEMTSAVAVFKRNAEENERLRAHEDSERAEAEDAKRAALHNMAETVERETKTAVDHIAERTVRMDANALEMASSADAVSVDSQTVAAAAEQALSNAQTVSAAAEELSASIAEIGRQVAQASEVTRRAVSIGSRAEDTIVSLADTVGRIGAVASLINDIAGQTNLLALNATIEAARAGDAGKGFAVVAGEVKNLANQTARSTEEITRQITEIRSVTAEAVAAMRAMGEAVGEIDEVAGAIAVAVEEQGAATHEISRNVTQTAQAAQEVSVRIAAVSARADSTGTRAQEVRVVASAVAEGIANLRSALIRVVRTATPEVDRRHQPRLLLDVAAEMEANQTRSACTIKDLSESGATVAADVARLAPGARLTLHFARIPYPLPGTVKKIAGDKISVVFDIPDPARVELRRFIGTGTRKAS
ncbi:MAG TPA: methyl-accepting chemotaxis protein [Patescibacteria group bacterium]|nr:methyl-accepting chemotaxis protein [Patescibacteria group bacterium]